MKLKFVSILILTLIAGGVIAAAAPPQPITVAVFDFTSNVGRALPRNISALITADLSTNSLLTLVERTRLNQALKEQALGLSGEISPDAAAKVGQLTGAKVLVGGRVIKSQNHLVIVAHVVGTETSRLYTAKVEGYAGDLEALANTLDKKITSVILEQYTNLVVVSEPHETRIDRIIKAIHGKKRPSVMINIVNHLRGNRTSPNTDVTTELGMFFQKNGFTVVDENSNLKPDVEITGTAKWDWGVKEGALFSCRAVVEIKAQDRRTGDILTFDRQAGEAVESGRNAAAQSALLNATDSLAERLLPILAQ